MKIAIVGAGISGIYTAHHLSPDHDVTLYEANGYLGGHTDTHHVTLDHGVCSVDTGFIVFNEHNYPLFTAFLKELDVASQPSNMSFSVSDRGSGLEYNAGTVSGLLSRRRNLIRPGFYQLLYDIFRFYRNAPELLEGEDNNLEIGEYLASERYSEDFVNNHIIPMASALWSSPPSAVSRFPARYFVAFMQNHKMLQVSDRPLWRTVTEGSSRYVQAFERKFTGEIRKNCGVDRVERTPGGVVVHAAGSSQRYDAIVLACHSDQALRLLADPTERERSALGAIHYQPNDIVLHSDDSVMPASPKAWASWNVVKPETGEKDYIVTYNMNMLQNIRTPAPLLVSLNADAHIDEDKVLLRRSYHHPMYTPESLSAQNTLAAMSGELNTYFAGAYLGWGFHEDGARSGQRVVQSINERSLSRVA